jgi:hypothetical protein
MVWDLYPVFFMPDFERLIGINFLTMLHFLSGGFGNHKNEKD